MAKAGRGAARELTAGQVASRLGIKIETVYAYVSRGVLDRKLGPDGRKSVFDARAVERLAGRRRGPARVGGISVVLATGLTSIEDHRVSYRGLDAALLSRAAPFEAVAEWLWLGECSPLSASRDADVWHAWRAAVEVVEAGRNAQRFVPEGTATADRLRVVASAVGPMDPLRFDLAPHAVAASGRRLISAMVEALPMRGKARIRTLALAGASPRKQSIAARLWPRLTRTSASAESIAALNAAMVLVTDHGLAASTLAARVAASVRADPYSIVAAGLGSLSGPLHGAASAPVHRLLESVEQPERAVAVVGEYLRREEKIPGYGHVIYKDWDPRARALFEQLRGAAPDPKRMAVVERVLALLEERAPVRPNVDFALGSLTYVAGMDPGAGEAIFGVARAAGWLAHALEEYDEAPLRFRPRAQYVGPAPGEGR